MMSVGRRGLVRERRALDVGGAVTPEARRGEEVLRARRDQVVAGRHGHHRRQSGRHLRARTLILKWVTRGERARLPHLRVALPYERTGATAMQARQPACFTT